MSQLALEKLAALERSLKAEDNQTTEAKSSLESEIEDANRAMIAEYESEVFLTAVQQNSHALAHVREQTPKICLAAVQQNGAALTFVKEQTPEICLAAVQKMGDSISIRKRTNTRDLFSSCKE